MRTMATMRNSFLVRSPSTTFREPIMSIVACVAIVIDVSAPIVIPLSSDRQYRNLFYYYIYFTYY